MTLFSISNAGRVIESVPVQDPKPANIVSGQAKIAITNTAVQLPANVLFNGLTVKSKAGNNAAGVLIGSAGVTNATDGTGAGYLLAPGESVSLNIPNSNLVFINGTAGDVVSFAGN
jgi:hypothetical protein